jgi:hypothetical protein
VEQFQCVGFAAIVGNLLLNIKLSLDKVSKEVFLFLHWKNADLGDHLPLEHMEGPSGCFLCLRHLVHKDSRAIINRCG